MSTQPKTVTKAVIAAAGFGTRFLPQTKAMPKEMLSLVDKPIIQYVVEELVEAGIKDIIIVTGYNKRSIEDHFDLPNEALIQNLQNGGTSKQQLLDEVEAIANLANFIYIRQKGPYGTATPVLNAAHLLGDEPFIYTYADDFFVASPGRTKQLISAYQDYAASVLACKRSSQDSEYDRYAYVDGTSLGEGVLQVEHIIEKPGKAAAPSDMASVSGYLLTADILPYLEAVVARVPQGTEFQIQPALQAMINDGKQVVACEIANSSYHDTGNKLDYLKTVVEYALHHPDVQQEFRAYLQQLQLTEGTAEPAADQVY